MELIRSSWAVALFLIFLGITDLTVHACLICRVSHLQRPRVVFDFAHPASHQLIRNKLQQPTQSFLPTIQPRKRIIRFDEEFIYSCEEGKDTENTPISEEDSQSKLKGVMISMIRWYRNTLSPIMPPNCRFLPSCSNYALQAIDEYGPYRFVTFLGQLLILLNFLFSSTFFHYAVTLRQMSQRVDLNSMENPALQSYWWIWLRSTNMATARIFCRVE